MSAILDGIQRTLEAHALVHDWTLQETHQDSTQLYLIGAEPEAVRLAHTARYDITIYRDHDGERGQASASLQAGDLSQLDARLDEAAFLAGMSHNPPYTLPRPAASYPDVESWEAAIGTPEQAARVAATLAQEVREALHGEADVRLSSMELFLEAADITLRTSTGVAAHRRGTHGECELVVTSRSSDGQESEAQDLWQRRRAADLRVGERAHRQAQYARDALRTRLPDNGQFLVVLPAETMLPFFDAVTYRSAAGVKYRQGTPWEAGQPIAAPPAPGSFDRLDITSDATLPFGVETRAFDGQGLPARRYPLIQDGVLARFWATQRYADYMQLEATGEPANMVLAEGTRSADDLLTPPDDRPLIYVVTFSWLNPDEITGDFVGEIRLGYQITRDGWQPIKGGTVSGNVFTALTQAHFSRETAFEGNYEGPRLSRFHGLTVAG
ncbi:MAG TPA: metallopeptidase TldD-related protein [Chloroflexia bacterium]|nr:metallopeptidase TldD-related protein [Chloroflexia bacterium]